MFAAVCFWRTMFPKFPKTHKFGRRAAFHHLLDGHERASSNNLAVAAFANTFGHCTQNQATHQ